MFVRSCVGSYGSFDVRSIPALEIGGTMLAFIGDHEGLEVMRRMVSLSLLRSSEYPL